MQFSSSPPRSLMNVFAVCLFGLVALSGCARSVVSTDVNADGTWKRTVKLYASMPNPGDPTHVSGLKETFVPPAGPEWKIIPAAKKPAAPAETGMLGPAGPSESYVAERMCKPGETVTRDVALRSQDGKTNAVQVANEVTVRTLGNGHLEYNEVIRWVSKDTPPLKFSDIGGGDAEFAAELKKSLPPALATPEKMRLLQTNLFPKLWRMMFGPNDPEISEMLGMALFPGTTERQIRLRLGSAIDHALIETYGDALTVEQRHTIARRLTDSQTGLMQSSVSKKTADGPAAGGGSGGSGNDITGMTFSVRLPGRILETNGRKDPVAGEVYWIFYSAAVRTGEVTLHAICDPKQPADDNEN